MELVRIENGQAFTDSLTVAMAFGKNHRDVLRGIEILIVNMNALKEEINGRKIALVDTNQQNQLEFNQSNFGCDSTEVENFFIESKYKDSKGEWRKCYLMTRDGFSLLVMGFTGQKALEWKLKYIEAFNYMEESIKKVGELSIADSREWELLKGSARSILMLKDKIQNDMREIEKIIRRVDDHRLHLAMYGSTILESVEKVENGKLRDRNEY